MANITKQRILCIYELLVKHTDPFHPLSTVELIQMLKDKHDINVSRNTICNDLLVLRNSNLPIEYEKSTQNKYYYDGHPFEISELKIFIDFILSLKSITGQVSQNLIDKFLKLTTEENAAQLRENISVEGNVKSDNRSTYYCVDTINTAINLRRKISFRYTTYNVHKNRCMTNDGNPYTLSPYELTLEGGYYYVKGSCDERRDMRTFRLDRIVEPPIILSETFAPLPEQHNPAEYKCAVFRMFDTEKPIMVELLCDVSIMKHLIDKFGKEIKTKVIDDSTFKAYVTVCASSTFYRWVFGFSGKIQIIGPNNIVEKYRSMLISALNTCR